MEEALKLTGKIIEIGKVQTGTNEKSGKDWKAQDFVIKPEGKWAQSASFRLFNEDGDMADSYQIKDFIEVSFNVRSREYKGKWYTNLTAYTIRKLTDSKEEINFKADSDTTPTPVESGQDDGSDLPF